MHIRNTKEGSYSRLFTHMHLMAVLCSFGQYPNLSLQLTQWTDGLNVGIFLLWRSWSLFYKEKAEDPILEFCSFDYFCCCCCCYCCKYVVCFHTSLFIFAFLWCLFYQGWFYYCWTEMWDTWWCIMSKLLLIQGFSMHCGKFLHQGIHSVVF